MLELLLILIILISGSTFFSLIFNKKIEKTFIFWIMSIILILYLFGLIGILKYGVYFIEILSFLMLIYDAYYLIKDYQKFKTNIFTLGLVLFVLIYLILIVIQNGRMLMHWDEFTHWGDVVKAMFTINDFSTSPNSMSAFPSYPPAMSLFQYFFMKVGSNFIEHYLYVSYELVAFSLFLPFICKQKNKYLSIIYLLMVTIFPMIMYRNFYTTIYIDAMVGLVFGYSVLSIITNDKWDIFSMLNLGLSIFVLVLLKDVGLFFSLIILIIFSLYSFFDENKFELKKRINKKVLFMIFFIIISLAFAKMSWNLVIKYDYANKAFSNPIKIVDIINLVFNNTDSYRNEVVHNFFNALKSRALIANIPIFNFISLFIVFSIIFIYVAVKQQKYKKVSWSLMIGLLLYCIGLLFIYCFKFSEYEALILASYERYISIYFLGLIFVAFILMINLLSEKYIKILGTLFLMVFVCVFPYIASNFKNSLNNSKNLRIIYNEAVEKIKPYINKNDKIFVISQNTTGFDFWIIRYSLRPNQVNENVSWSIGKPYYDGDIWTEKFDAKDWINTLIEKNYSYVFIFKNDEKFIKEFGSLFNDRLKIKNQSLYKVDVNNKKLVLVQ